ESFLPGTTCGVLTCFCVGFHGRLWLWVSRSIVADHGSIHRQHSFRQKAQDALEGLQITYPSEEEAINKLRNQGWHCTSSASQRAEFPNANAQFLSDLRPIAYLLRTKRSKRCRTCRHILSKPESKVQTTRFRIRLVAL